jgi:hypothetical protein
MFPRSSTSPVKQLMSIAPSFSTAAERWFVEEAREDYDGAAVAEEITRALGRIKAEAARASLVRRLERVTAGTLERSDADELASALWRKRHPELLQVVAQRRSR